MAEDEARAAAALADKLARRREARAAARAARPTSTCQHCGVPFTPSRADARYCCPAHRVAAHPARRVSG